MITNFPSSRDIQYFISVMSSSNDIRNNGDKGYIRPTLPDPKMGTAFCDKINQWLNYIDKYRELNPEAFYQAELGFYTKGTTLFITEDGFPITDGDEYFSLTIKSWETPMSGRTVLIGTVIRLMPQMSAFYKSDDRIVYIKDLDNKNKILEKYLNQEDHGNTQQA